MPTVVVVTDSEIDLDASIKCVTASPVKVVPGEMLFFFSLCGQ